MRPLTLVLLVALVVVYRKRSRSADRPLTAHGCAEVW